MVKSISTVGVTIAGLALAMSAALAAPKAIDGSEIIEIEAGNWEWTHSTQLGPAPFSNSSTDCVSKEDASISLESVVEDLNGQCDTADITRIENGYGFTLNCQGDITGLATGKLIVVDKTSVKFQASGAAAMFGMTTPFSLNATGNYVGACD